MSARTVRFEGEYELLELPAGGRHRRILRIPVLPAGRYSLTAFYRSPIPVWSSTASWWSNAHEFAVE